MSEEKETKEKEIKKPKGKNEVENLVEKKTKEENEREKKEKTWNEVSEAYNAARKVYLGDEEKTGVSLSTAITELIEVLEKLKGSEKGLEGMGTEEKEPVITEE